MIPYCPGPHQLSVRPWRVSMGRFESRGGLTIWKLSTARGPGVSRGPHEMPLVPFS
ncbi:unnamed protein product [Staurois parvus]|uniref:Uncharacterized protein n=1 Tax=Staurois parvus TaxID=386267 RepID=A0ABN9G1M2_9NEOB|nr:unnamed protein product [Staurois parvus]